jgi:hypothetical protein
MSQEVVVTVKAAIEHLRSNTASLCNNVDQLLICTTYNNTDSSTLPKIKYWVSVLMKTLPEAALEEDDEIDYYEVSGVLAAIIRILDDTDVNNLMLHMQQIKRKEQTKKQQKDPPKTLEQIRRRKRLPIRSSELVEAMHESQEINLNDNDDDNNEYDASSIYLCNNDRLHRAKKQRYSTCADMKISLKEVLNVKSTGICYNIDDDDDAIEGHFELKKTSLVLEAAVLRRDLYQFLVEVDTMSIRKSIECCEEKKAAITEMISSLIQRTNTYPNSPSMRLSAVMAVDSLRECELSDTGYQMLLDDLLNCNKSSSKVFYADIVSECDIFSSPSRLVKSLTQIMKATLRIHRSDDTSERRESLRKAISQIVVRRKNILLGLNADVCGISSKLYSCYKLMLRRISNVYDNVSDWIHPDMPNETEEVVSVLQALGILSIFCWDGGDDEQQETYVKPASREVLEQQPNPFLSLRAAHNRLGPCRGFDKILSHCTSYHNMNMNHWLQDYSKENGKHSSSLSCINVDVLLNVFSFLGYRSLARASVTCKSWNLASNDNRLWITLYFRKYKNAIFEEERGKCIVSVRKSGYFDKFANLSNVEQRKDLAKKLSTDSNYNWRYIFKRKYQAEKHVSKTFLRCDVIGCVAHFAKRSANMHKKMHEKVLISRAAAIKALQKLESNVMSLRKQRETNEIAEEQPSAVTTPQIYSAEDALVEVFSFLHVKELVPVCKLWRTILKESDALWKQLYKNHFPLHYHQSSPANQSWSSCFHAAFNAEKGRQRIMTVTNLGWPTKLCPVVGCCTVLYNETAYSKHILTHEQQFLMQKKTRKLR